MLRFSKRRRSGVKRTRTETQAPTARDADECHGDPVEHECALASERTKRGRDYGWYRHDAITPACRRETSPPAGKE